MGGEVDRDLAERAAGLSRPGRSRKPASANGGPGGAKCVCRATNPQSVVAKPALFTYRMGFKPAAESLNVAERIAIVSDHAAFDMKAELAAHLREGGHEVLDLGTTSTDSVDYPDYGYRLGEAIADGRASRGIALCGSGIGISIAVNRNPACRCALVSDGLSARLAREHNDANVIALGARLIGIETAMDCVAQFLATPFAGGRHQRRVDKLTRPDLAKEPA
jgi:ribose 5-phosphate isomerase B